MLRETKIYHDGSHYVGIPHTIGDHRKKRKRQEELVEVQEQNDNENIEKPTYSPTSTENEEKIAKEKTNQDFDDLPLTKTTNEINNPPPPPKKKATRSQIFNELYNSSKAMKKYERKNYLIKGMRPYFNSNVSTKGYVEMKLERKRKNHYNRVKRFMRKANMNNFNYFVTFTYDDKLHTEESFRKKLINLLRNYQKRKGWKYMGVFERSPSGRLHFHGLLKIPSGTMPGELIEKKDYNLNTKKMQRTIQNTFFNEKFGRSDFDALANNDRARSEAYSYILKYVEKTGEKIIYSRNLPMYVISDVLEEDVITTFDDESGKMVLYDKFTCINDGELIGEMNEENKDKLRSSNS